MTDHARAIEAGARAIHHATPRNRPFDALSKAKRDKLTAEASACIEAAIASGALVPASAVAEMRERCAAVAYKAMIEFTSLLEYEAVRNSPNAAECATLCAKAAREIADKLRQLDTAPASGDYVAVPQSDLTRVIEIARRCEWAPEIERVAVMLNAASRTGGGK